jgi:hypothetical protein
MKIVGAAIGLMVLLALFGVKKVDIDHPGGGGMVWTLLHPLHICIIVAGGTLAGAKMAEQSYRFALAVTLTIGAGLLVSTALATYVIHNYVVRLNWQWLR